MSETPSPRQQIATDLHVWFVAAGLADKDDPGVRRGERAWELSFTAGQPHYAYGDVSVFNPEYLALVYQTADTSFPSSERRVFRFAHELTRFVEALIAGDRATAERVPVKSVPAQRAA